MAAAIRTIPFKILTFSELGLPPIVTDLARKPRGLVLVTGPTGSGKSTTLASIIDKINTDRHEHILTVEKKGFARAERIVQFSKDRSMELTIAMNPLPPEPALAITTDPAGVARLFASGGAASDSLVKVAGSGSATAPGSSWWNRKSGTAKGSAT